MSQARQATQSLGRSETAWNLAPAGLRWAADAAHKLVLPGRQRMASALASLRGTSASPIVSDATPEPCVGSGEVFDTPSQRPIIFIHIPKTAGTAFSHYLKENCGNSEKVVEAFYGDYSIYDGVEDAPVILGHTIYREMAARFPAGSFVTWLRHPVDRVISQYKSWHNPRNLHAHWKDHAGGRDFQHIYFTQNASFDEFAMSEDLRLLSNIVNAQTGILSSLGSGHSRRQILESAKENLERRFKFFGIVERFGESMKLFQNTFEWRAEFKDDDATANRCVKHEIRPSEQAIARIMQRNDLDLELHEFACELFERRLGRVRTIAA
ncbi:MAG: sulfotransferase family 2 domain-containing protein [Planctomycetota bacterium]|nr:sulfotransferase family 2 domain-containing protein [Planctomycetaceae bacterium]MDQ3330441.1 sulfotransferase family 2 domain-containing protein [Planctomycetota bacterium]